MALDHAHQESKPRPEPEPTMTASTPTPESETDPRFPSGPWTGFFLQKLLPGHHWMEMRLTFRDGKVDGEGRDRVGTFRIHGTYAVADGRCWLTKTYLGRHEVLYQGYNEGRGIWGTWELPQEPDYNRRGGFHIWPEGMEGPTGRHLREEADVPAEVVLEPAGAPD